MVQGYKKGRDDMAVKMTLKQKRFCDEYIITGNATRSAINAGYSEKTAKVIGDENLTKPYLRDYIDERIQQIESDKIAEASEVLKYLTSIMRGGEKEQTLRGVGEGVQTIDDIEVSAKDRIKAAELLGKRYRLFTDKVEVEGAIPVVISGEDELED